MQGTCGNKEEQVDARKSAGSLLESSLVHLSCIGNKTYTLSSEKEFTVDGAKSGFIIWVDHG